jgi:hypothetical protein
MPDTPSSAPPLLPAVAPLGFLLGTWRGRGRGFFPTIEPFEYLEEIEHWLVGKPFVGYLQRTRHAETQLPLHGESGFWRVGTPADELDATMAAGAPLAIEGTIAQPGGFCEILVGELRSPGTGGASHRLAMTSTVTRTPTAKDVSAIERIIEVDGDVLRYTLRMAAMGLPLQDHLEAELHRV